MTFDAVIAFLHNRAMHLRQSADLEREGRGGSLTLAKTCDEIADETIVAMRVLAEFEQAARP